MESGLRIWFWYVNVFHMWSKFYLVIEQHINIEWLIIVVVLHAYHFDNHFIKRNNASRMQCRRINIV